MSQRTRNYQYDFRGHHLIPATASGAGTPFVKADTSAAGAPTVVGVDGGGVALTLAADVEVENLCLYMGDKLPFDIDDIIRAEFVVKGVAAQDSATQMAFGLCSARNDTIDSLAAHASFRTIGNNDVVVESDDGTTDKDDIATGITLGATFKRFAIDFSGMLTKEPPALSVGGKGNVQFFGGNSYGQLRRLASGTVFDMSAHTTGLQLYFQIQKTADSNVDALTVLECCIEVKLPNS